MEDLLKNVEWFMREKALSWGMIALYFWIIACGVGFYYFYHTKVTEQKNRPRLTGKFKDLIERLQKVKSLLMETDDNVEEAEEIFKQIEKDAKPLIKKWGEDRQFVRIIEELKILFVKADSRIAAKERDQAKVARFLQSDSGGGGGGDDDEVI